MSNRATQQEFFIENPIERGMRRARYERSMMFHRILNSFIGGSRNTKKLSEG